MKCHPAKTNNNTVAIDNLLVKRRSQILRGVTSILLQIIKASALIKKPSPQRDWLEQLQLMPLSFVNGNKAFDTYALIDHGSQFTFLLDTITNFLALPCEAQTSTTLQYVNIQNEMPLSKITAPVIITPYKSLRQSFEISRAYSTPAMNVTPANIFELNQLCDTFNNLRHINFPQVAGGKIGALLGVKTFAYTHPIEVIPGNINQPFAVKTKLGWTLAGEYETSLHPSEPTIKHHSATTKPFIYHVSRQQTEEPHISELVEQFWKIESEGTQEDSSVLSDEDNDALKFFRNLFDITLSDMKLVFLGKRLAFWRTTITVLLIS